MAIDVLPFSIRRPSYYYSLQQSSALYHLHLVLYPSTLRGVVWELLLDPPCQKDAQVHGRSLLHLS
jgi:hypothetical protein